MASPISRLLFPAQGSTDWLGLQIQSSQLNSILYVSVGKFSERAARPWTFMNEKEHRFDRQIRLFGSAGQERIRAAKVAVIGIGGLGTHVVQQLSLLGVKDLALVDAQEVDTTNLNRYIGVRHDDPIPGTLKVRIGE